MDTARSTFAQLIQDDRANRESKAWRGPFLDYLEKVKEDPTMAKLAHSRFYETMTSGGMYPITESDDSRAKRLYKDEPLEDADHNHNRTLYMRHEYDGRALQWEYAERTLTFVYRLWGQEVGLETIANGQKTLLSHGETGFSSKLLKQIK